MKNILVDRNALYAIREWAALFDAGLISQGKINDDKLARALDRLFAADRATLQTRIVLAAIKGFDLEMSQIHNDTTSVTVSGAYDTQSRKAVQLKRGHNKEGRPDLKQLVYSLCITADGAVPVHFKAYDGNQTDDGIHLETWNRLRTLLQHPNFIYVADCKICRPSNYTEWRWSVGLSPHCFANFVRNAPSAIRHRLLTRPRGSRAGGRSL
jgi:transposase